MGSAESKQCLVPHDPIVNAPCLRVSSIPWSSEPIPLADRLGLKNKEVQKQMAEGHPYVFKMGGSNTLPLADLTELMKRNYPEILHDNQQDAVFIPETHLPINPRVIHLEEYEAKKKALDETSQNFHAMKPRSYTNIIKRGENAEVLLLEELRLFYKDKKVIVLHGAQIWDPRCADACAETDVLIVDMDNKLVISMDTKTFLSRRNVKKAVDHNFHTKKVFEEYFSQELESGEWCYVPMIYATETNIHICPDCSDFIIKGRNEVSKKLSGINAKAGRAKEMTGDKEWMKQRHKEYLALVQALVFVVLAVPLSTTCTITSKVFSKVVGDRFKNIIGQGDLSSIIFWTKSQANLMLGIIQFVMFISPWATGKTLCMREKARMRAQECPDKNIYFAIVRESSSTKPSLLELEVKNYFKDLPNVTVVGIQTDAENALKALHEEMISRPPGDFMVDELIMPEFKHHKQWSSLLMQLKAHVTALPGQPLLWMALAGIQTRDQWPEETHFEYLDNLTPGFHLPEMSIPLRNTREVINTAEVQNDRTHVVTANDQYKTVLTSNPPYSMVDRLLTGVKCCVFPLDVKRLDDRIEVMMQVQRAAKEVMKRTGEAGFPVIVAGNPNRLQWGWVINAVRQESTKGVLVYTNSKQAAGQAVKDCTEEMVDTWLQEKIRDKCLITDNSMARGWESSHTLVVSFSREDTWKNCVMRTVGFCALVRVHESLFRWFPRMADQDEVEDYPFTNADEHTEEEKERDAKLVWVGVANSTKHKLKIKWSVSGARRVKKPKILFKFGLGLSIPGVRKVDPTIGYEKGETDLVLTGDSSSGTTDQAAYVYEKVQGNADTDENSKLVHLEFYQEGEPEFFWQTTVKKKHGVIVIEDPDDASKLSVIPAAGQFLESSRWMPSKDIKHPRRKRTYDPAF